MLSLIAAVILYTNLTSTVERILPSGESVYERVVSYGNADVRFVGASATSRLTLTGGATAATSPIDNRPTTSYSSAFRFDVPVDFANDDANGGVRYIYAGGSFFTRPVRLVNSTQPLSIRRVKTQTVSFSGAECTADFSKAQSLSLGVIGTSYNGIVFTVSYGATAKLPRTTIAKGSTLEVKGSNAAVDVAGELRMYDDMYMNGSTPTYTKLVVYNYGSLVCDEFIQGPQNGSAVSIVSNGRFTALEGITVSSSNGAAFGATNCTLRTKNLNLYGEATAKLGGNITLDVSSITTLVGRVEFASGSVLTAKGNGAVSFLEGAKLPELRLQDGAQLVFRAADPPNPRQGEVVRYEDFGAKGDGVTDDLMAIVSAHQYANGLKLPVRANDRATYYIGGDSTAVEIKTNTDFGKAHFTIDDSSPVSSAHHVFKVTSGESAIGLADRLGPLKKGAKSLGVTLPKTCLVRLIDNRIRHFIRWGTNANDGSDQQEVVVVAADGTIDPATALCWDYPEFSSAVAMPVDDEVLTVRGGVFTTLANQTDRNSYFGRGIQVLRSNTRLEGITHYVRGEEKTGATYNGFVNVSDAAFVEVTNCTFTAHRTYNAGTYDLTATRAAYLAISCCTQTIDILDGAYWGLMGSNFSRNLTLENCVFSRFDAHQGVANAAIRNCTLGYAGINAIGFGTFIVENTTGCGYQFINLREDYGSTWWGEMIVRNCTYIPGGGKGTQATVFGGRNLSNHDFGYECAMPRRIILDRLHIDDRKHPASYAGPYLFANFNPTNTSPRYVAQYPYAVPEKVLINQLTVASGKPLQLSSNPYMFRSVKLIDGLCSEPLSIMLTAKQKENRP